MLIILSALLEAMAAQAQRDHPIETCGVIAGAVGSRLPTRLIPMRNAAQSETFFRFDPQEQLRVWREMEVRDEEPKVIYHSHTASLAYPSREDVLYAAEPGVHYVILSSAPGAGAALRSFRIVGGRVTEESIRVVERYVAAVATP